jgi:sporulation protein YlmC with PRC-barrel domain
MLKKLMITTAVSALLIGTAAAQGTGTPRPGEPPATPPAAKSETKSDTTPAAKSTEMSKPAPAPTTAKFINSQSSDQFLATKFKGTDVVGSDDTKVGDVSDILFDKDGKILAYVVGVGGFLGIGAKDVALEPAAFQVVPGDKSKNESDKLKITMTKDQLKQAANFEPYKAPSMTTGAGGTMGSRPAGTRPTAPQ